MSGFGGGVSPVLVVSNDNTQSQLLGTGANTTETVLKTVTLPALAANSTIDIDSLWSLSTSLNIKTIRIRLNGIGGTLLMQFAETTNVCRQHKTIIRNNNSASAQKFLSSAVSVGYGPTPIAMATAAIDTSVPVTLVFTAALSVAAAAALETINCEGITVKVIL
jgi:hypothetical protein